MDVHVLPHSITAGIHHDDAVQNYINQINIKDKVSLCTNSICHGHTKKPQYFKNQP